MKTKISFLMLILLFAFSCNVIKEPTKLDILQKYTWQVYKATFIDYMIHDDTDYYVNDSSSAYVATFYNKNIYQEGFQDSLMHLYWFIDSDTTEIYINNVNSQSNPTIIYEIKKISEDEFIFSFFWNNDPDLIETLYLKPVKKLKKEK